MRGGVAEGRWLLGLRSKVIKNSIEEKYDKMSENRGQKIIKKGAKETLQRKMRFLNNRQDTFFQAH